MPWINTINTCRIGFSWTKSTWLNLLNAQRKLLLDRWIWCKRLFRPLAKEICQMINRSRHQSYSCLEGGLFGALGWLRDGTNILVLPKDFANLSLSSGVIELSSLTRSIVSSSLTCLVRSSIKDLIAGMNWGSEQFMFWNFLSWSFICRMQG